MSAKPGSIRGMNNPMSMASMNADAIPRCNTHRKRLKFFCVKHELLLCSVCAVKRHRSCEEILTVNEACEDKKSEGKKCLDVYSQRIVLIENAIVERKAAKKLLDTNAQEIQNEIHEVTQKLIDLVKHEERTLLLTLQTMQTKEGDTLEKDISNLEAMCSKVKDAHDSLKDDLKLQDADLILAVIKEKQRADENTDVDTIVKKRFREVDFKFIASPHITSFLKHFKNLGQVMLSDESNYSIRNNQSTGSSGQELPPSPVSKRHSSNGLTNQQQMTSRSEEPQLSARERWERDRQLQTQRRAQNQNQNQNQHDTSFSGDKNVFNFDTSGAMQDGNGMTTERRSRPMRALPRPGTPDLYTRPRTQATRRDFTIRPMSTPPVERPLQTFDSSNDNDQQNQYRHVKAEPVSFSERSSPVPMRSQYINQGDGRSSRIEFHFGQPVHIGPFPGAQDHATSPSGRTTPTVRSPGPVPYRQSEDVTFGRSFAAVQVSDPRGTGTDENRGPISPRAGTPTRQTRGYRDNTPERRHPAERPGTPDRRMDTDRALSPREHQPSAATDEEKTRRWVHQISFPSSGIEAKKLISGIGALYDGRLVLVDQERYTVQLFNRHFRFVYERKLESRPFDVTVISGNKIVVSLQTERLLKFFLITGDTLTPVADLGVPCDLVCYGVSRGGGNYCVCCGDEVWILSDEGRVINRLKNDISGNALFVQAEYVTTDRNGTVLFVSDAGNNKVLAIQVDGKRLWEFTYQGFKPSGLKLVEEYLYVCDCDQHRVLMLNLEGNIIKQSVIGRLENPRAICFNTSLSTLVVTQMRYEETISPKHPVHVYVLR